MSFLSPRDRAMQLVATDMLHESQHQCRCGTRVYGEGKPARWFLSPRRLGQSVEFCPGCRTLLPGPGRFGDAA